MAGINSEIAFAVAQIQITYADDLGNIATGAGTGFFLRLEDRTTSFVTNRHNVDATLNPRALTMGAGVRLANAAIGLRSHDGLGKQGPDTRFFQLDLSQSELRHSVDADVSAFIRPAFKGLDDRFGFNTLNISELATQEFLSTHASIADLVTFIGYPAGPGGVPWWDTKWNSGIGRLAGLASRPDLPFTNPQIPTGDVTLVSGLSFGGSSGSPVVLHMKPTPPIGFSQVFATPKVLGIMSGHWWEQGEEPGIFRHSGLSYFTRATAIRELLRQSA